MNFNMKTTITHNVSKIRAMVNVRYWEDTMVNGVEDTEGSLIPNKNGDIWDITVDADTGVIENWPEGTSANVHYKVCDEGVYQLIGDKGTVIVEEEGYVLSCFGRGGYGDYVSLDIDENGKIENWAVHEYELDEYFNDEDDD